MAILLGGMALTSGGDDEPGGDDAEEAAERASTSSSSSSTTRRRTVVRTPRPTSTTVPPPIAPEAMGVRLAMLRTGEVVLIDIDGNGVTRREVPTLEGGARASTVGVPAVVRGSNLVFHSQDRVWSMPLHEQAPPRELADALVMIPAADHRDVWLVLAIDGRAAVQRWRGDGSISFPPLPLPVDWAPVAEVETGLVLRRGDRWQVWDPGTGETVRMSDAQSQLMAAHGRVVAWTGPCDVPVCSVHLTDVVTGDDRTVLLGATQLDWIAGGFSPDGRHLAMRAFRTPSPDRWEPGILLVDAIAGTARFVEMTDQNGGGATVTWSPDSRWLFMLPANGTPSTELEAYSPARDETVRLQLPSRSAGFVVVPY